MVKRRARIIRRLGLMIMTFGIIILFLFPFIWMLMGSFKSGADFLSYPPTWLFRPTLINYREVLFGNKFAQYGLNSALVAVSATSIGLLIGIPAADGIARYRRTSIGVFLLAGQMAPGISFIIPFFVLAIRFHLAGTYFALIASHLIITLPIIVWMMIGFIEGLPIEIEQAALIDGCSIWGILCRIVVPLTLPGIAASAILAFIYSWNNFLFSVVLSSEATKTLPLGILRFIGYADIQWGPLTAAASIVTLPVLVLALLLQRHIVRGLVSGGV